MANPHTRSNRIKLVVAAVLVVLTIIVVLQNTDTVHTKVLFGTISMPRSTLLAITFATGALAGSVLCLYWKRKKKNEGNPRAEKVAD
jgi:uncharacterized integral membrane protein